MIFIVRGSITSTFPRLLPRLLWHSRFKESGNTIAKLVSASLQRASLILVARSVIIPRVSRALLYASWLICEELKKRCIIAFESLIFERKNWFERKSTYMWRRVTYCTCYIKYFAVEEKFNLNWWFSTENITHTHTHTNVFIVTFMKIHENIFFRIFMHYLYYLYYLYYVHVSFCSFINAIRWLLYLKAIRNYYILLLLQLHYNLLYYYITTHYYTLQFYYIILHYNWFYYYIQLQYKILSHRIDSELFYKC